MREGIRGLMVLMVHRLERQLGLQGLRVLIVLDLGELDAEVLRLD